MLSTKTSKLTNGATPADDLNAARAIVESVPKSPELIAAEAARSKARSERDGIRARLQELNAHLGRPDESKFIAQIRALGSSLKMADRIADNANGDFREARTSYARDVEKALKPLRSATAQRALGAIAELKASVALLDEIAIEIRKAGGDAGDFPPVLLAETETRARELA